MTDSRYDSSQELEQDLVTILVGEGLDVVRILHVLDRAGFMVEVKPCESTDNDH